MTNEVFIDDATLDEIETCAKDAVRKVGRLLAHRFGTDLEVKFKDKSETDPVTDVDNESQAIICHAVSDQFPDHLVVGEEDEGGEERRIPDFVWVVDPLDGTKNFLNGLPIYACSVGVMFRGIPVVAAVHVPWPGKIDGVLFHARKGRGTYCESESVMIRDVEEPGLARLTALPGIFRNTFRVKKPLHRKLGEVRNTGSIAYDLAMTAGGVLQYTIAGNPRIWDIAGGVLLMKEAGGSAMAAQNFSRGGGNIDWRPMEEIIPSLVSSEKTVADLRRWSEPVIFGSPRLMNFVTANLRFRHKFRVWLSRVLSLRFFCQDA